MNDWDDYRLVLAIHKGKTLRNAAHELGVNHSTVSRRLAILNKNYGSEIVRKTPSGLCLSPLGEKLLVSAEKIESLVIQDKRFERAEHLELEGDISVSVPPPIMQFLLLDDLMHFQRTHPRIALNIHSSYEIANLDECEADVVIRVSNTPDEHLVGYRLFSVATQYYAAKDYLKNTPPHLYQWITNTHSGDRPEWIKHTPFPDAKIGPCITDLTLRHQAANSGHGMIRGACYIAHNFNNLVSLAGTEPEPFQQIWVLSHPDLAHINRIQVLKKYLADALKSKKARITGESETANA
ncbi:LysR family transcriptional regulator [Alteromonas sp. D210916BOD_24]|uniref:LysR family transcriptional regulator n=1 Tax=Alteromonas sp. D210916BOD_24 TaxID=3157618 RepID=UPI00399CDE1A